MYIYTVVERLLRSGSHGLFFFFYSVMSHREYALSFFFFTFELLDNANKTLNLFEDEVFLLSISLFLFLSLSSSCGFLFFFFLLHMCVCV